MTARILVLAGMLVAGGCVRDLTLETRGDPPASISASSGPHEVVVEWAGGGGAASHVIRATLEGSSPVLVEGAQSPLRWAALDTSLSWSFEVATIDVSRAQSAFTGPVSARSLGRVPLDPQPAFVISEDGALGAGMATADVDGDGASELLLGEPSPVGLRADLYSFSSGVPEILFSASVSTDFGSAFGRSVAIGDFDRDGGADLAVGRPGTNGGQVQVHYATTSGWDPVGVVLQGPASSDFGDSLWADGDLDGDGFDDLLVGAPAFAASQGRVELFGGSATGLRTTPSWTVLGNAAGASMGSAITKGEVDGDGRPDVLVASDRATLEENEQGAAFVYFGSQGGPSLVAGWEGRGLQAVARYGERLASGDVNCDGFDDILVSAPLFEVGGLELGAAYVHHGSPGGPSLEADSQIVGTGLRRLGEGAALADLDGDGCKEVVLSSSNVGFGGTLAVFDARDGLGEPLWMSTTTSGSTMPGRSMRSADFNGDGIGDLVNADPFFGTDLHIRMGRPRTGPVASAGFALAAAAGAALSPVGASFRDVRAARASYTCTWSFGDGSAPEVIAGCDPHAPGEGVTHVYESRGRFAITLRVECEDGRAGEAATTVLVDQVPD